MFASRRHLLRHFREHGAELGYRTPQEYLEGAERLINRQDFVHSHIDDQGATLIFDEETGEFLRMSATGIVLTYFRPDDRMAYWLRQIRRER